VSIKLRRVAKLVANQEDAGSLPYVALENVESWTGHLTSAFEDLLLRESPDAGVCLVEHGDVLFGKLRPYLAKIWRAPERVYASSELMAIRGGQDVDSRWLEYLAMSKPVVEWAIATSEGVKMPRTNWEKLGEFIIDDLPSLKAQGAIADFLEGETERIDALLASRQRLLELLALRRTAVMLAGVSGAYTSTSSVSSPVPWLEAQPPDWRTAKLSLVASLGSGHTPSRSHPEWWTDCTVPWITTGEVAEMRTDREEYVRETRERISDLGIANSSATIHPAGTVVLCRTASAGYSAIMASDMATSQDFATWTCGPLLRPRFLLLCLRAMRQDLLGRLAMGSTHKTIYMPDIESLRIPLPDVQEQDRIVVEVWARLHKINRLEDTLKAQSELLVERRRALITAAVTGQLDIPEVAA